MTTSEPHEDVHRTAYVAGLEKALQKILEETLVYTGIPEMDAIRWVVSYALQSKER